MTGDRIDIRYVAGKVRGIEVVVTSRPGSEHCQVQLHGTFEGISDIGEPFVGRNALRMASVFSESVFAALECADTSWSR